MPPDSTEGPLIDFGPFADPLIETAARGPPSLLRSPPPVLAEDDDDLVLSFLSDRLRAQDDIIRLPAPARALTRDTFLPPPPRSPSIRTLSSASSRAISPFDERPLSAFDERPLSPSDARAMDPPYTGSGTLRRSALSPVPSSSLSAAHRSPPARPAPPAPSPQPRSPGGWSLTSDPDAEWSGPSRAPSRASESDFDFAEDDAAVECDVRSVSSAGGR